jgi:hypothetical protein
MLKQNLRQIHPNVLAAAEHTPDELLAAEQQNEDETTTCRDVWEDAATMMYIKTKSYPSGLNKKEKTMVRMRAARCKF